MSATLSLSLQTLEAVRFSTHINACRRQQTQLDEHSPKCTYTSLSFVRVVHDEQQLKIQKLMTNKTFAMSHHQVLGLRCRLVMHND